LGDEPLSPSQFSADESPNEAATEWGVDVVGFQQPDAIGTDNYTSDVTDWSNSCCKLCPCASVWAEGLILGRNNRSSDRPLVLDLNTTEDLLGTDDLDFNWTGGFRVGYIHRAGDCWGLELGYLGLFDHSAAAGVAVEDSLTLPDDFGLQVNNFFAADEVDIEYQSDLHSAEANLVHCCCYYDRCGRGTSLEWLGGFRYVNLNEEIGITADDSAESTSQYSVETRNRLYGAQIGARLRRCHRRWNWETTGKAGLYGNDMEQIQSPIIDFPDFEYRSGQGSDDGGVAFVGDLNFTGIYQLNPVWGFRLGYNLFWIEGVALAPDQLDFTNTTGSGTDLEGDGGVFLHGVSVGLEARR
jgi:hypothetical protein